MTDYDPCWDYEIDDAPDPTLTTEANSYIDYLSRCLLPRLDHTFNKIHIGYVILPDGVIATYIDGTRNEPWILLDLRNIISITQECNAPIELAIKTSILHELGHAIQDIEELEYDEDDAEKFAIQYYDFGNVYKFWENVTTI